MTFTNDLHLRVADAQPVWEATSAWPEVLARLPAELVAAAGTLGQGVPVLRTVETCKQPPLFRPPGHRRAFYIALGGAVLGVKGTEPLAHDFAASLDELAAARVSIELRLGNPAVDRTLTRAELGGLAKFPLLEGKVPGCLTLAEALADAEAALAVQRAHLARFGQLALLPVPLFVARWPAEVETAVLAELRPRLRGRAWDVVEPAVRAGLGVFAYHYPTLPLRLVQLTLPDAQSGRDLAPRREALARGLDASAVFDGWLGLTARLLALGFVPKDPESVVTGDCLQVQNLVLDGGLADTASLIAAADLDDRALRDALRRTVHELAIAATRLLVGLWVSNVDLRDRLPDLYVVVWNQLARRVVDPTDARISAILAPTRGAVDELTAIFAESL